MRRSAKLGAMLCKRPLPQLAAASDTTWARAKARVFQPMTVDGIASHTMASSGARRRIVTLGDMLAETQHNIPLPYYELQGSSLDPWCQALPADGSAGAIVPLTELPLAWIGGLLGCHPAHLYSTADEAHGQANGAPRRPTDYELSLGKIVDVLQSDYPAFFERLPNFDIYDDNIVLELGRPFHGVEALHGKRKYRGAIAALQRLGSTTLRDGLVRCRIADGGHYGHAVKVAWECHGTCLWSCPVYISAISLYSLTPQVPSLSGEPELKRSPALSHRIHRHTIEFVEIQPPSLRSLLLRLWWERHAQVEPVLAMEETQL